MKQLFILLIFPLTISAQLSFSEMLIHDSDTLILNESLISLLPKCVLSIIEMDSLDYREILWKIKNQKVTLFAVGKVRSNYKEDFSFTEMIKLDYLNLSLDPDSCIGLHSRMFICQLDDYINIYDREYLYCFTNNTLSQVEIFDNSMTYQSVLMDSSNLIKHIAINNKVLMRDLSEQLPYNTTVYVSITTGDSRSGFVTSLARSSGYADFDNAIIEAINRISDFSVYYFGGKPLKGNF